MKALKVSTEAMSKLYDILEHLAKVSTVSGVDVQSAEPVLMGRSQCTCAGSCKGSCKTSCKGVFMY